MIPFEFCPPIFEVASSNPIWQGWPWQGACDQIMAASGFFQLRQLEVGDGVGAAGVRALVGDTKNIKATKNHMVACRQISERLWSCCGSLLAYMFT